MSIVLVEVANRRTISRCPSVRWGWRRSLASTRRWGAVHRPAPIPAMACSMTRCSVTNSSTVVYFRYTVPGNRLPSRRRIGRDTTSPIGWSIASDSIGVESSTVRPGRTGTTSRVLRNVSARRSIWSRVPPSGKAAATSLTTSARPKVEARPVSPSADANRSNSLVGSTGATSRLSPTSRAIRSGVRPTSAARSRHSSNSSSRGWSCFGARVANTATCRAAAVSGRPCCSRHASSWCRRRENASI